MEHSQDTAPPALPVVALGASAGGLEALDAFFDATPPDAGLAFVVITHQHPDHASLLPELLGRRTEMAVHVVAEATPIAPDQVYLPPPGVELSIEGGVLVPVEAEPGAPVRLPIDRFFRALARDQGERAIAIVLSGTGSDGTIGIKQIKGAMGMVMAQQPRSAGHPGMPGSAIATDLVDYILAPEDMPRQLLAYLAATSATAAAPLADPSASTLDAIFELLRVRTGHDFSGYKKTTIRRRLERRMNLHRVESAAAYVELLREHPQEAHLLVKELLIGVTSFFRDPAAFAALEQQLSELVDSRASGDCLRVWVTGCSTGEEAYSLAMCLRECMDRVPHRLEFQIFATDLDDSAIEIARAGVYPEGIAADVSPARLERFFIHEQAGFRVKKELREHLVFARQNLVADPPFTRLDLLSCRNLLIYLDTELQRRLLPIFHYALKPGGLLFLGSSESTGPFAPLFAALDKKSKLFRRREVTPGSYIARFPATQAEPLGPTRVPAERLRAVEGLVHEALRERLVPPSVLVRQNGEVVHIHGRTGAFLEPAPGPQPQARIFDMAREGLELHIAAAMRQAARQRGPVIRRGVRVESGGTTLIDLRVEMLDSPEALRELLLISFVEPRAAPPQPELAHASRAGLVDDLERELKYAKETNQSTVEELETANEELKSTNEELQSTNEELQSANEELETSKEEMQSLNEELQTVNAELQGKVEELSSTTDDMKNLLNGTDIATIFLDEQLCIKRYTDQAREVIRLIPSDVGRPIGDLVSKLRYDDLAKDAAEVLRTLVFKQAEIRGEGDTWYLMHILPYRTTDNVIAGLVVTFVDITKVKGLQAFERRIMRALEGMSTCVYGLDPQLRVTWSSGPLFGHPPAKLRGQPLAALLPATSAERLAVPLRAVFASGEPLRTEVDVEVKGTPTKLELYIEAVRGDEGRVTGLTCVSTTRSPT